MQHHRRQFLRSMAAGAVGLTSLQLLRSARGAASGIAVDDVVDELKPDLIFRSVSPRNAEPPLPELVRSWVTPNRLFYVRSHAPNPVIDPDSFRLSVTGLVDRTAQLSLQELERQFERVSVTCTLTCAGNRRYEHSKVKPVGGVQWEEGPIGNAEWSGFRLADVLTSLGIQDTAEHVWFDGLDRIDRGDETIAFGGSVPLSKVFEQTADMPGALLVTHMNGEPLPIDHGFPLRTVVPGYIGARSVKWLGSVTVSDRPSPNHYVADAYKLVEIGTETEWDEAGPLYRFPVNSVLCSAEPVGAAESRLQLKGYALPTGLATSVITAVEVSGDGGASWRKAELTHEGGEYCWTLWQADIPYTASTTELLVRAFDSTGHSQPESVPWNVKGYMYNAWHRVPLTNDR